MLKKFLQAKDVERLENTSVVLLGAEPIAIDACATSCGETCNCFPSYLCCQTLCLQSGPPAPCTGVCSHGPTEAIVITNQG